MKTKLLKYIILFFIFILLSPLIGRIGSSSIVHQWQQNPKINYESFGPYSLTVIKYRAYFDIFDQYSSYSIFIGSDNNTPIYGHFKEYDFSYGYPETFKYIKSCSVEWLQNGVWFIEPSGIKILFPKALFIGGR